MVEKPESREPRHRSAAAHRDQRSGCSHHLLVGYDHDRGPRARTLANHWPVKFLMASLPRNGELSAVFTIRNPMYVTSIMFERFCVTKVISIVTGASADAGFHIVSWVITGNKATKTSRVMSAGFQRSI